MDRRLWIFLCVAVLAVGTWLVLREGEEQDAGRGWQPDLRSVPQAPTPTPQHADPAPEGEIGADPAPRPPSPPPAPRGGPVVRGAPGLPLADVRMPHAQWDDASLQDVLQELAELADKQLSFGSDVTHRVRDLKVTLDKRDATVAHLLDLVLGRREDLNWTMRDGAIEIYVDDD